MEKNVLKSLQAAEYKILIDFDHYCKKHNIMYSLYAGTLLGAVRHKGFIPWDDDIDVCMTRSQYVKFCLSLKQYPMDEYYFQNYMDDAMSEICHGKLRRNETVLLSQGENEARGHHGIWLDIFPLDKISKDFKTRKKTFNLGKLIVLLTRVNGENSCDKIWKKVIKKSLKVIPLEVRKKMMIKATEWLEKNDTKIKNDYEWVDMSALYCFKYRFPQELVERVIQVKFNESEFYGYKDYHTMLTIMYGDYMQYPPVSEQVCRHNPIKIQFIEK